MKSMKYLLVMGVIMAVLCGTNSCKKIQQDEFISGLWKLDAIYVDSSSTNFMNNLQNYTNGNNCCIYKMDFQRDDVVFGYYQTYDTFTAVSVGTWELTKYNEIFMRFDRYFDGTFKIEKTTNKHYILTSEANHIRFYDGINDVLDTAFTKIEITRL